MSAIVVGCDHAGFPLKLRVIEYLKEHNLEYTDVGCYDEKSVDYPIIAEKLCAHIIEGKAERGVLVCGTGIGVSIAANRHREIHAALCHDVFTAKACRSHNNANVLTMGARVIGEGAALEVLEAFLTTGFEATEKRLRRVKMYS